MNEKQTPETPKVKPSREAKVVRLVCHAPFGRAVIDGETLRFKRGDKIEKPSKETIASADPASWEHVKG